MRNEEEALCLHAHLFDVVCNALRMLNCINEQKKKSLWILIAHDESPSFKKCTIYEEIERHAAEYVKKKTPWTRTFAEYQQIGAPFIHRTCHILRRQTLFTICIVRCTWTWPYRDHEMAIKLIEYRDHLHMWLDES